MAQHLRRFVTSPLPIFEIEYAAASGGPPLLVAAAKCLGLCIKVILRWFLVPHSLLNTGPVRPRR